MTTTELPAIPPAVLAARRALHVATVRANLAAGTSDGTWRAAERERQAARARYQEVRRAHGLAGADVEAAFRAAHPCADPRACGLVAHELTEER